MTALNTQEQNKSEEFVLVPTKRFNVNRRKTLTLRVFEDPIITGCACSSLSSLACSELSSRTTVMCKYYNGSMPNPEHYIEGSFCCHEEVVEEMFEMFREGEG